MRLFGKSKEGKDVYAVTLTNKNQMEVTVITLGATIQSIILPDGKGVSRDIVLGYDTPVEYQEGGCYFGALVGRNANRIGAARTTIDGVEYQLEKNNGENNLHSGAKGLSFKLWNIEEETTSTVKLSTMSLDGEQGFPGNMKTSVVYTLTEDNVLRIEYYAVSDKTTIANFTNHTYFNLEGHDSGNAMSQQIAIFAESYTPVIDSGAIPTGEIASVEDTPMDLRVMKTIGESIDAEFDQLQYVGGYDHNFVLEYDGDGTLELAARAFASNSGIMVECYTDCPGVQFYAGNFISPQTGKGGVAYGKRHGFCLETQYFPDSANQSAFVSPILKAGDRYYSKTEYHFTVQ